jgi:hypothetical protein
MNVFSIGSPTTNIIESLVTSGRPLDDILQRLDSLGIQWYVTEQGDLMLRYWQVGAERLVPLDHVARIRASQSVPTAAEALEWLSTNLDDLRRQYAGQWLAIVDHRVVASAPDLPSLLTATAALEGVTPFITQIPAEPVSWRTAFPGAT